MDSKNDYDRCRHNSQQHYMQNSLSMRQYILVRSSSPVAAKENIQKFNEQFDVCKISRRVNQAALSCE